ncbi:hypothetical protein BJX76DRAFT_147078 [Aspergillus varians]
MAGCPPSCHHCISHSQRVDEICSSLADVRSVKKQTRRLEKTNRSRSPDLLLIYHVGIHLGRHPIRIIRHTQASRKTIITSRSKENTRHWSSSVSFPTAVDSWLSWAHNYYCNPTTVPEEENNIRCRLGRGGLILHTRTRFRFQGLSEAQFGVSL